MIGLFGGAFDPPHVGHLLAATYAQAMDSRIGRIAVIPSARHPWKPNLSTTLEHRTNMLRLLFEPLRDVAIDDNTEWRIANKKPEGEPVYTIDVVEDYIERDRKVCLIVGQDEAEDLPRWHRYDDLMRLTGSPCVIPRGCTQAVHVCEVSSTKTRDLLLRGCFEEAAAFVPRSILDYIRLHRLYMSSRWARTREAT